MTNNWVDIKNADLILIMGENAAEAHPCGFKWVTEALAHQATQCRIARLTWARLVALTADDTKQCGCGCNCGAIQYVIDADGAGSDDRWRRTRQVR